MTASRDTEAAQSAEKVAFHAARMETHIGGPCIRCVCGWSVTLPTALAAINAYGDHRAAAAVTLTPPGKAAS